MTACLALLVAGWWPVAAVPPAAATSVTWTYAIVATPDLAGPSRRDQPGFEPPTERHVVKPTLTAAREPMVASFEAVIDTKGRTIIERTVSASSRQGEQIARRIIERWRFHPARFRGRPTRVRISIAVGGGG